MSDLAPVLNAIQHGDPKAGDKLLPLVCQELRKLAAQKMANEVGGRTLRPAAPVHEAWLRLVGAGQQTWQTRAHFFGAAAEAMRRIHIGRGRRLLPRPKIALASQLETLARGLEAMNGTTPLRAVHLFNSDARADGRPESDVELWLGGPHLTDKAVAVVPSAPL